jgi:hypothetical protein
VTQSFVCQAVRLFMWQSKQHMEGDTGDVQGERGQRSIAQRFPSAVAVLCTCAVMSLGPASRKGCRCSSTSSRADCRTTKFASIWTPPKLYTLNIMLLVGAQHKLTRTWMPVSCCTTSSGRSIAAAVNGVEYV